jgi:hypothetical protein
MEKFHFTGEWEFKVKLSGFAGFRESDGTLSVDIYDLLNEDPEPLPEQVAAINYLLEHHETIASNICDHVFKEYPELIKIYDELPPADSADDIKKHIRVNHVHILTRFKNGISFMDLSASCAWDEEHGLGFGMHQSQIIFMGGIGDGYSVDEDEASRAVNLHHKQKPQIYFPHPKYGKLKPSQQSANRYYELDLIRGSYNEEFKALITSGKRDVNYVDPSWGFFGTFIAWAIQYNNQELVEFLIARNARLDHILHEVGRDKQKIEWLLSHGVSINERSRSGHVLLRGELFTLRGILMNQEQAGVRSPASINHELNAKTIRETVDHIQWLISKGADPSLADLDSVLNFWGRDYDNEKIKSVILESIKPVGLEVKKPLPDPKNTPGGKWWKFWR